MLNRSRPINDGYLVATAEALKQGQKIDGPAVIEGYTATSWLPPGWTATLDASDNLILWRTA